MKYVFFLALIFILCSCRPCEPEIVDNGPLVESDLSMLPYKDGRDYQFRHSNGQLISFNTFSEIRDEQTFCDWYCCDYIYHFQTITTILTPDYPVFNFRFEMSNMDTSYVDFQVGIGRYGFQIPNNEHHMNWVKQTDSVILDSLVYYNVFMLSSNYGSEYGADSIFADSLYYNYDFGILKILMSNDESYTLVR